MVGGKLNFLSGRRFRVTRVVFAESRMFYGIFVSRRFISWAKRNVTCNRIFVFYRSSFYVVSVKPTEPVKSNLLIVLRHWSHCSVIYIIISVS